MCLYLSFLGSANVLPISNNELDSSQQTLKELRDLKSIILNSKRGGVADECCLRSCSFEQLQNYCLYDQTNNGVSIFLYNKNYDIFQTDGKHFSTMNFFHNWFWEY